MKILITGGHLTPALSVIEQLPRDAHVLYVGRKYALEGDKAFSLEYQTILNMHIPFAELKTGRLQRKLTIHTIPSLLRLPLGLAQAMKIVSSYKPDVILSFGGYVSVPVAFAAKLKGIPIVIHEQTLEAGLANRVIAPFASKICISWQTSAKFFPKNKTILTGNPAVATILDHIKPTKKQASILPKIVIVGGSLGSHAINLLVEGALEKLTTEFHILHQTGDAKQFGDFDRLVAKKNTLEKKLQDRYLPIKFIDPKDIISAFQQADLVVTRAGINTITTLLLLNKPAFVIPLPVSQNNEQRKNGLFLKEHGLGEVVSQDSLTAEKFFNYIHAMIKNKDKYINTKELSELLIHKKSAQKIIDIVSYEQKQASQKKTSKDN